MFDKSPNVSNSSFFELIVVKTWCGSLGQLLNRFIRQFAISFHAFLRVTFHAVGPRDRFRVRSPHQVTFQLLRRRFANRTCFIIHQQYVRSICIDNECIPNTCGQEMMSVLPDQPISSISDHRIEVLLPSSQYLSHPHTQVGIDFAVDAQIGIPSSVLFPSWSQQTFYKLSFTQ